MIFLAFKGKKLIESRESVSELLRTGANLVLSRPASKRPGRAKKKPTSSQAQAKALDSVVVKSKHSGCRKSSSCKSPTRKGSGSKPARSRDSEPEDPNFGLRRSARNRPVRDPTKEESTNGNSQSDNVHAKDTEDLESLVTGFTAVKPSFPGQNEFENGKTKALQIIGQLISKELRPLKENISKLETDVSFLVNTIA